MPCFSHKIKHGFICMFLAGMMLNRKSEVICKFLAEIYLIQQMSELEGTIKIRKVRSPRASKEGWPAHVHQTRSGRAKIQRQAFWLQEQGWNWSSFHWPSCKVAANLLKWSVGNREANRIVTVNHFPSTSFLWPYKPINCTFSGSPMTQHT